MSWQTLPLELKDRVIDCLYDDPEALKHCALTCHALLRRSRLNRFHTVTLTERNVVPFLQLLRFSPIGDFVHNLIVMTRSTNMPSFGPYNSMIWIESRLPELAAWIPFVRRLEVQRYDTPRASTFEGFSSVENLVFKNSLISNVNQYRDLLCCFPSLHSARFQECMIGKSEKIASPEPNIPSLRSFDFILSQLDPPTFVEWLLTQPLRDTIEKMALSPIQKPAIQPAGSFLKAVGASLRELRISMIFPRGQDNIPDVPYEDLSLTPLASLELLSLGSAAAFSKLGFVHIDQTFAWYAHMLATIDSKHLRIVSFSLMKGDIDVLVNSANWERIIRLLSTPQFTRMDELQFHILSDEVAQFIQDLKKNLPILEKAGKLRFLFTYTDSLKAEFPTVSP